MNDYTLYCGYLGPQGRLGEWGEEEVLFLVYVVDGVLLPACAAVLVLLSGSFGFVTALLCCYCESFLLGDVGRSTVSDAVRC